MEGESIGESAERESKGESVGGRKNRRVSWREKVLASQLEGESIGESAEGESIGESVGGRKYRRVSWREKA